MFMRLVPSTPVTKDPIVTLLYNFKNLPQYSYTLGQFKTIIDNAGYFLEPINVCLEIFA